MPQPLQKSEPFRSVSLHARILCNISVIYKYYAILALFKYYLSQVLLIRILQRLFANSKDVKS